MYSIDKLKKIIKRNITDRVSWRNLRGLKPVSNYFGCDRGTPVDRYYIEKFLNKNRAHIKGTVLEVADSFYCKKFDSGVSRFEILYIDKTNAAATIIGDLSRPETLPQECIDCFICTQTFNFIYDFKSAIKGAYKLLSPNGVLLATLAGISQISRYDMERWGDYWRFTTKSAHKAFSEIFGESNIDINCDGNVLAAIALLEGISQEELTTDELDYKDNDYQVIITVKAIKRL